MNLFIIGQFLIVLTLVSAFLVDLTVSKWTEITSVISKDFRLGNGELIRTCSVGDFECQNGECIRGKQLCDGKVDCSDSSDELLPECLSDSYRRNQEATCDPLNSLSRAATCSRFGDRVSCQSPVLPFTKARITCRINYGPDPIFSPSVEQDVECRPDGRWGPEPITCSPVCGAVYLSGSKQSEFGVFPWHASIWKEIITPQGSEMRLQCSATIVEAKFAITTAHCVMDGELGRTEDPRRLRVTVGNAYDASNSGQKPPLSTLQKVKNIYTYCEDVGRDHSYISDIALIELLDPFEFSTAVLPACLDVSTYSEQAARSGITGRVYGLSSRSDSSLSPVCQTVGATHVSNSECGVLNNPSRGKVAIGNDQFCATHSNRATGCDWVSGGGFVVNIGGLWHLTGIFIMDLGLKGTDTTCGENPYSLYTKVSPYSAWIQDVMFQLERYKTYPSCKSQLPLLHA